MSPNQITRLRAGRLWYVATVYSKWPHGIDDAFDCACEVTASLLREKVRVFCPIAHTHSVALRGNIDPLDHEIWMEADRPMMDAASGLIVVEMPGWRESKGVTAEIAEFVAAGKPIEYLEWTE